MKGLSGRYDSITQVAVDCKQDRLYEPKYPIPVDVRPYLRLFVTKARPFLMSYKTSRDLAETLWLSTTGQPVTRHVVWRSLRSVAAEIGCNGLNSQTLRAVQHSLAHSMGGDQSLNSALARRLNHSRPVSQRIYVRLRNRGENRRRSVGDQQRDERRQDSSRINTFFCEIGTSAMQDDEQVKVEMLETGLREGGSTKIEKSSTMLFSCPICEETGYARSDVEHHIRTGRCINISSSRCIMCRACGAIAGDSLALTKHVGNTECTTQARMIRGLVDNGEKVFSDARAQIISNNERTLSLRKAIQRAALARVQSAIH